MFKTSKLGVGHPDESLTFNFLKLSILRSDGEYPLLLLWVKRNQDCLGGISQPDSVMNSFESDLSIGIDFAVEGESSQEIKDMLHAKQDRFKFF